MVRCDVCGNDYDKALTATTITNHCEYLPRAGAA
jgi:hypothetical protein